jgi:hypothetical protein
MNCWLSFSCTKHWEGAGSNSAWSHFYGHGMTISAEAMKGVPRDAAPREMKGAIKYEWASVAPFGSGDWQS